MHYFLLMSGKAVTPREPVSIDVGSAAARRTIQAGAVFGVIGLAALVAAFAADIDSTGVQVAAIVVGLALCALGLVPVLLRRTMSRPRRLVIDAGGLRWEDPQETSWAVTWPELARVTLTCPPPGVTGPRLLVLRPAEPAFHDAHPEMAELATTIGAEQKEDAYVMRLAYPKSVIRPLDEALSTFAPDRYDREGPEIR